jgi:hypothetical protein
MSTNWSLVRASKIYLFLGILSPQSADHFTSTNKPITILGRRGLMLFQNAFSRMKAELVLLSLQGFTIQSEVVYQGSAIPLTGGLETDHYLDW